MYGSITQNLGDLLKVFQYEQVVTKFFKTNYPAWKYNIMKITIDKCLQLSCNEIYNLRFEKMKINVIKKS